MLVEQKYRKCRICECIGGLFVTRKSRVLARGTVENYIENMCRACANEKSIIGYYRRRSNPELLEKERKRLREYKLKNKEKIKSSAKIYWMKNKEEITKRRNLKKELKEPRKIKRRSHHRIPSNKHMFSNFNLRSISNV